MIKAIIGLGNPGAKFELTRHNIGFLVVDEIAQQHNAQWVGGKNMLYAEAQIMSNGEFSKVWLVKPQTFMNSSGEVMGWLTKKGVKANEVLVVHDELEKKFGTFMTRFGGSARGHNGLRSIISFIGADFWRLRIGIDRPKEKSQVGNYVLQRFAPAEIDRLEEIVQEGARIAFELDTDRS